MPQEVESVHLFRYGIKLVHQRAHCMSEFAASIVDIVLNILVNECADAI